MDDAVPVDEERAAAPVSRREEIFALAADVFWTKGYHAASMNDVAEAVGVRKPSLYHHIRTKEELLYEMSLDSMRHMIDAASAAAGTDPESRLRDLVIRHVEALLADRSKHATALTELRSLAPQQRKEVTDLRSRYDRLVDEAVEEVQVASGRWTDLPPRLVRLAMLGMLNWTVFWFHDDGPETPREIAESFAEILLSPRDTRPGPRRRRGS